MRHPFLRPDTRSGIWFIVIPSNDPNVKTCSMSTGTRLKGEANRQLRSMKFTAGGSPRLDDYIVTFKAGYMKNHHSASTQKKQTEPCLDRFLKFMQSKDRGNMRLDAITASDIESYGAWRTESGVMDSTMHMDLRTLRCFFRWAVRDKKLTEAPYFSIPKDPVFVHEQHMTHPQFQKLVASIRNPWLRNVVIVAYYTGMRLSELRFLRWVDVNFEMRVITVANRHLSLVTQEKILQKRQRLTKSRYERTIPMHPEVITALRNMERIHENVFAVRDQRVRKFPFPKVPSEWWWSHGAKQAMAAAQLPDTLKFHSLRHSFATNMIEVGVPVPVVKEYLGHQDIDTTMIYDHVLPAHLQDAIGKLPGLLTSSGGESEQAA